VDHVAKQEYLNRSELIRQVLRLYLDESLPDIRDTSENRNTAWRQSFGSVKPLAKKLSFKLQREIAWEDKINATNRR